MNSFHSHLGRTTPVPFISERYRERAIYTVKDTNFGESEAKVKTRAVNWAEKKMRVFLKETEKI